MGILVVLCNHRIMFLQGGEPNRFSPILTVSFPESIFLHMVFMLSLRVQGVVLESLCITSEATLSGGRLESTKATVLLFFASIFS